MQLFIASSGFLAAVVFFFLCYVVLFKKEFLVRPSVVFLGFFWLQVQFASALEAGNIYESLQSPWIFLLLIHVLPVVTVAIALFTFSNTTREVAGRSARILADVSLGDIAPRIALLLGLSYAVLCAYLLSVPFNRTGLYALLFAPESIDQYREHSMKLLDAPIITYSFAVMEKVTAPLAAAFSAMFAFKAFEQRRYLLVLAGVASIGLAGLPTLAYGARGPFTMVLLAAILTLVILNLRRLRISWLIAAFFISLLPITLIMTLKSEGTNFQTTVYQFGNIVDRAIGRNYIDNVWHLKNVEENGFIGIAGIEKLAGLLGVEPVDLMNEVGRKNAGNASSFGIGALEFGTAPEARKGSAELDVEVDVSETASSGTAFFVLNYAMFGLWSVPLSLVFMIGMDLLLFAYLRMPRLSLAPVLGAMSIPLLSLSFSFATTVLASKGMLLIPLLGWLVGMRWFALGSRFLERRKRLS